MKRTLLLLLALAGFSTVAQAGDVSCRSASDKVFPVQAKFCSAKDGSDAHYLIVNKSKYAANACWEVMLENGSRSDACRNGLVKTEPFRVDCPACGRKGANVLFITVKTYATPDAPVKVKKEKGKAKKETGPAPAATEAPATIEAPAAIEAAPAP